MTSVFFVVVVFFFTGKAIYADCTKKRLGRTKGRNKWEHNNTSACWNENWLTHTLSPINSCLIWLREQNTQKCAHPGTAAVLYTGRHCQTWERRQMFATPLAFTLMLTPPVWDKWPPLYTSTLGPVWNIGFSWFLIQTRQTHWSVGNGRICGQMSLRASLSISL